LAEAAGYLPVPRAVDLVLMACAALSQAHAAGIVHRDVKPSNLFVAKRDDGRSSLKVLDFGVAKLEGGARTLTEGTDRLGAVRYMSPEQLTCPRDVGPRTDVWALGVVLYELLGGRRPFEGEHDAAVTYSIAHAEPPALSGVRPELPSELCRVVAQS